MKILVTGAEGFIGKNLCTSLNNIKKEKNAKHPDLGIDEVFEYDMSSTFEELNAWCSECDFVFHLAGVNRPQNQSEFMEGNFGFTSTLLDLLKQNQNPCPIMLSSSIQAALSNPYGESKKAGENMLFQYGKETGAKVLIYRFPNVFGKWCRPNYNSAIATFCHNIARDIPITVNDPTVMMSLVYIDDLVEELIRALKGQESREKEYCIVPVMHLIPLGEIVRLIKSFKNSRIERAIPDMSDALTKKLYSTYLSYLPTDQFRYELKMNTDHRGSFTEFMKTIDRGQVSVNISKPGIVKGNHWHHSKNEKFLVVSGKGVIRFRQINSNEVIEYYVSGEKLEVIDIPTGYTHNIENLGESDMVTIMWANEPFDPNHPDTYFMEV